MTGTPIYDNLAAQLLPGATHRPEQVAGEAGADAPGTDGQQQAESPGSQPPA